MNNNKPKMAANSPILPMTEHYARLLLKRLRLERECNAVWTDDDTASTDGTIINLPRQAFGVTLDRVNYKKKALILSKGLGLHEVAHFTQNLRKLSAHCRQNGVNKFYSNILLDAQADKSILKLLREEKQYFIGKRKIMRRSVWPTYMRDMEEAKRLHEVFAQSGDYADYLAAIRVECSTLALIGKYKSNIRAHTNAGKFAVSDYGKALTKFIAKTPISEQGLFQYIKSFGVLFPELCDSDPITLDEESQIDQGYDLSPEGEESDREIETLSMAQRAELDSCLLTLNYLPKLSKRKPAMQEARALAEKLHPMLSMDYDVKKVTVPVRLDRRKMARGVDPIPFYDNRKHGKERARKLTLFVDRSGSMGGIMSIVKIAAQAICIAVQRRGGSVARGISIELRQLIQIFQTRRYSRTFPQVAELASSF